MRQNVIANNNLAIHISEPGQSYDKIEFLCSVKCSRNIPQFSEQKFSELFVTFLLLS